MKTYIKASLLLIYLASIHAGCSNMMHDTDTTDQEMSDTLGSLQIARGTTYTHTATVNLTISFNRGNLPADIALMRFSNDATTWTTWETYTTEKQGWLLPYANGAHIVYGEFQDTTGNHYLLTDTIIFLNKLIAPDPDSASDTAFGTSVSVSNDGSSILVGCEEYSGNNIPSGSSFLYQRTWDNSNAQWSEWLSSTVELFPDDGTPDDQFGHSVALSGDGNIAVIGAWNKNRTTGQDKQGSVYVYTRTSGSWTQPSVATAKLTDPTPTDAAYFGNTVAVSGDGRWIVVGAYNHNSGNGTVCVYERSSSNPDQWNFHSRLAPDTYGYQDYYGYSVAISNDGTTIAAGSIWHTDTQTRQGAVYVYTTNGSAWSLTGTLTASNAGTNDQFGYSIDLDEQGTTLVIGANFFDTSTSLYNTGAVYLFELQNNSWQQTAFLLPSQLNADSQFGNSVALADDASIIVIGAWRSHATGEKRGMIYFFKQENGSWQDQSYSPLDSENNDFFGKAVAINENGTTIVSSSQQDDIDYLDQGSVYVIDNLQ